MQNPEEFPQSSLTSAVLIYNQSIHSTTGHSPFSILYGPYINEPNIDNDLTLFEQYNERRKRTFHEQIYKIVNNKQSKNTQKQNKNTEKPPEIHPDDTVYRKTTLRNKMNPQYVPIKVSQTDKNKITGTAKKKPISTHFRKIKRLRKKSISFQPPDPDPNRGPTQSNEPLPSTSGAQTPQ